MNVNVIETSGLGKRYGSTWALRECSLAVPAGHVTALIVTVALGALDAKRPGQSTRYA